MILDWAVSWVQRSYIGDYTLQSARFNLFVGNRGEGGCQISGVTGEAALLLQKIEIKHLLCCACRRERAMSQSLHNVCSGPYCFAVNGNAWRHKRHRASGNDDVLGSHFASYIDSPCKFQFTDLLIVSPGKEFNSLAQFIPLKCCLRINAKGADNSRDSLAASCHTDV